ncbi:PREDICTED: protein lin-54 homolog [Papilio xuthus]|uniref:Protein lin-54 homolog n=1 Tax=Papilio xuthus TaxID=66420 RepID=A0AAJ7EK07_PAPXU|nr:PREDICTED: protein lin-54 homolog [Papilio xuthus]
MDHNLGDDLNLDGSMGVDFGHSEDTVVSQADITLEDSGHEAGIAMDFENIEEQPMLMDTGSEEIIDFMGEQFTLQEYAEQEDHSNIMTTSVTSNEQTIITSQADNIIQIEPLPQKITTKQEHSLSKATTHKNEISPPRTKKNEKEMHSSAPRQVAIAPKPGPLAKSFTPAKQYAIAPKPLTVLTSKSNTINNSFLKKVTLAGVMQGSNKGNTVLTQIGKQLVMMPAAGAQKLKLVTGGSAVPTVQYLRTTSGDQTQLIQAKTVSTQNKPVITKLILPGQPNLEVSSNAQSLLTKVAPVASTKAPTQIVAVQQKNMPFALGNKVLLATPTKSGVKFTKKQQLIAFKSPEKAAQAAQGSTTKKVLITSNPTQNVILKTTAPPKAQVMKDGNVVLDNQRTQLHQINVPGKGIQYIRLITNSNPAPVKTKLQTQTINVPAKTFLLTDSKGNLIQMSSDKMMNNCQSSPLLVASAASSAAKVNTKPQRKLVRIAPLIEKRATLADKPLQTSAISRSSQSLLAPITSIPEIAQNTEDTEVQEDMDSKAALHAMVMRNEEFEQEMQVNIKSEMQVNQSNIESNMEDIETNVHHDLHSEMNMDADDSNIAEVEVDYKRDFVNYSDCDEVNDKSDRLELSGQEEHPLIVIPSNFIKESDNRSMSDVQSGHEDSQQMSSMMNMDAESMNAYQSPTTPQTASENEFMSTELGLRLRKACNCTKSQCLKLYCECFANGEFCNRCNCNNCHNNLENEERRQKAIRGCLDRNPNAFRPKIGKAKVGGPEMIRRHNKGCNCKRSGCLKNYCECYEAKIACTSICKCVGCRNVEETLERTRRRTPAMPSAVQALFRPPPLLPLKQPCSFITTEVVEAVCQCLLAAGGEGGAGGGGSGAGSGAGGADAVRDVIDEFARCLQDIISAAHHTSPLIMLDEDPA